MKKYRQVKEFSSCGGDSTEECNEFLKEIGTRVIKVTSFYNTIIGGVNHIVEYWH